MRDIGIQVGPMMEDRAVDPIGTIPPLLRRFSFWLVREEQRPTLCPQCSGYNGHFVLGEGPYCVGECLRPSAAEITTTLAQ